MKQAPEMLTQFWLLLIALLLVVELMLSCTKLWLSSLNTGKYAYHIVATIAFLCDRSLGALAVIRLLVLVTMTIIWEYWSILVILILFHLFIMKITANENDINDIAQTFQ